MLRHDDWKIVAEVLKECNIFTFINKAVYEVQPHRTTVMHRVRNPNRPYLCEINIFFLEYLQLT